jgi:hypothetical protein
MLVAAVQVQTLVLVLVAQAAAVQVRQAVELMQPQEL